MTATFALICALLAGCTVAAPRSAPVQPAQSGAPLRASGEPAGRSRDRLDLGPTGAARDAALEETGTASPAEFDLATSSGQLGGAPLTLAGDTTRTGVASWFDARGYQGAVPWWKAGQQPVWATVSRFADGHTYSVTVLVTGFCQCLAGQPGERLIDLSPAAFRSLGVSLSVGLIEVTMQVPVQGPRLPATDSEGSE